jgi:CBS-domain-containing membrane protein
MRAHHDVEDAKQRMIGMRVRHLPIVDDDGRVLGMLTMRKLLEEEADVLRSEATSLENYAGYDGATG